MKDLKKISDQNPFKIPDNYFEETTAKIISATTGAVSSERRKGIKRRIRTFLAVAASMVIFVMLGYTALHVLNGSRSSSRGEEIIMDENNQAYLDEIDILTLEESVAQTGTFEIEADISNNEIIDYLVSENIDILDIYEQF
jgi:hypothetical protein